MSLKKNKITKLPTKKFMDKVRSTNHKIIKYSNGRIAVSKFMKLKENG